jgi:hypothetical protein
MLSLDQKREVLELAGYKFGERVSELELNWGWIGPGLIPTYGKSSGGKSYWYAVAELLRTCVDAAWEHYNAQA